jgi:hypothetical protein
MPLVATTTTAAAAAAAGTAAATTTTTTTTTPTTTAIPQPNSYEPEVDPALQVVLAVGVGETVNAMVYSNGLIIYSSTEVRAIVEADDYLRTGAQRSSNSTSSGGGVGGAGGGAGDAFYPTGMRLPLFAKYRHPAAPLQLPPQAAAAAAGAAPGGRVGGGAPAAASSRGY